MSGERLADAAVRACGEYETWAVAIPRLRTKIGDCRCPHEVRWRGEDEPPPEEVPSCFARAASEDIPVPYSPYEEPPQFRRRSLDEIAAKVADCPGCTELVRLIRARKHARQRFGVAKREVRRIGKLIAATARTVSEHATPESAPESPGTGEREL